MWASRSKWSCSICFLAVQASHHPDLSFMPFQKDFFQSTLWPSCAFWDVLDGKNPTNLSETARQVERKFLKGQHRISRQDLRICSRCRCMTLGHPRKPVKQLRNLVTSPLTPQAWVTIHPKFPIDSAEINTSDSTDLGRWLCRSFRWPQRWHSESSSVKPPKPSASRLSSVWQKSGGASEATKNTIRHAGKTHLWI